MKSPNPKTLQIQVTIRPDLTKPISFEGTIHGYWMRPGGFVAAVFTTLFAVRRHEGEDVPSVEFTFIKEPAIVRFECGYNEGDSTTTITAYDAATGAPLGVPCIYDDDDTSIIIRGWACDVAHESRAVMEPRCDDDAPTVQELEREARHA